MGPRKRDRSKTPEVPWELLPNGNSIGVHAGHSRSRSRDRTANGKNGHARAPAPAPAPDPALLAAQAAEVERDAWRRLVILLAQLKGDRKVEQLLREKHPELLQVADRCGASSKAASTLHAAKDAAREWFSRGLRGSNQHGPAARAKLCKQLMLQLLERASQLCSGVSGSHVEDVLDRGRPTEEGPLVCSLMARELRGSRYEGLWISRKGPAGHYYLGDEQEGHNLPTTDKDGDPIHPRVHAVVKVVSDQLVISGFFLDPDDDTMSPAKVPIGPFLSVYFEGMSVREASNAWKNGPPKRPATPRLAPAPVPVPAPVPAKQGVHMDPKLQELQAGLPPGWEAAGSTRTWKDAQRVRESRSKRGMYFFAHPASGRSQMERPKA